MLGQQLADQQKKRGQQLAQEQQMEQFVSGLPQAEQARFRAFPTQAAEAMFRQPERAPGVVGEYTAAVQAGLIPPGTTLEQYVALKKPPGTTVNVGGERDPFDVDVAKEQAKVFSQISSAGKTATSNLRRINRLENILNKVETGGPAAFKQAAGSLGIKTEGVEDIQAATAIINSLVPEQRAEGSGPMSDADLELFKQSLPRIINQPGGNKLIIEGMKEINQYLVKESEIANDVIAKRITRDEGRRKLLELNNPIEDFFGQDQLATPRGIRRFNPATGRVE
jgi:flagellar protein FlgJ